MADPTWKDLPACGEIDFVVLDDGDIEIMLADFETNVRVSVPWRQARMIAEHLLYASRSAEATENVVRKL